MGPTSWTVPKLGMLWLFLKICMYGDTHICFYLFIYYFFWLGPKIIRDPFIIDLIHKSLRT